MKVGMLTSCERLCGVAQYSRDLCASLGALVDLEIVATWHPPEPWNAYLPRSIERLNRCNVVHIQHEYSFWGSMLPGRNHYFAHMSQISRPKVLTAHTLDLAKDMLLRDSARWVPVKVALASFPPYRDSIERKTFDLASRIIVHDPHAASRLETRGIASSKIRVIPMGVPTPNLDPSLGDAFRSEYDLEGRKLIVVFGFTRSSRGYETVLDAMAELGRDTVLVIAGGPQTAAQSAYFEALLTEIARRGLCKRVVATGYLSDEKVSGVMQAADVVLCPQQEGTGSYSVQLAFGYGCPIVASDLPCFEHLEREFGCLLTFASGDAQDLAHRINAVLGDETLSRSLSDRALAYAREHTWDKIAARTVQVYRELVV